MKRIAAIDIGTNTILMLISDIYKEGHHKVLRDEHAIARLGEGVDNNNVISDKAVDRAGNILKRYRVYCNQLNVDEIIASGTSVLRDAANSRQVRDLFSDILGTEVKVISGIEEARLSYLGTVEGDKPGLVIDIGGGSTEIISEIAPGKYERESFDVGSVRVTERFFPDHPPGEEEINKAMKFIEKEISLPGEFNKDKIVYAVAGTPTTIAAVALGLKDFERDKIQGYELTMGELERVLDIFLSTGIDRIVEDYGVHPKRADVITAGTLILRHILGKIQAPLCRVSIKGLRYGMMVERKRSYKDQ